MRLEPVDRVERWRPKFFIQNDLIRCAMAEFFCTAILLFGGCSSTAQYVLSKHVNNEWIGVNLGWGLALAFAVYGGFHISGSHLNPAVSFFLLTKGRLSTIRFAVYSVAQIAGGFVGAMLTFFTYFDALNNFDNGTRYTSGPLATAGIFATYPQPYLSVVGGIVDQVVGTAFLCVCVCLITDKNNKIPVHLQPLLIGLLVALIGMCVGMNSGYAINPARDLGPRLFTLCAGWGWETFSYQDYKWFWIPIIAPMIGAVIGSWLYEFFIGFQLVSQNDDLQTNAKKSSVKKLRSVDQEIQRDALDLKNMNLPSI